MVQMTNEIVFVKFFLLGPGAHPQELVLPYTVYKNSLVQVYRTTVD